ncbi:MAG: transposase [Deinococcota bacterium]
MHGRILRLRLLDDQGEPVYAKPIWLFSTNTTLDPLLLAQAYLSRASHELTFRFMKQHLSLTDVHSPCLEHVDAHLNLVTLAMNLLLASKANLQAHPDP